VIATYNLKLRAHYPAAPTPSTTYPSAGAPDIGTNKHRTLSMFSHACAVFISRASVPCKALYSGIKMSSNYRTLGYMLINHFMFGVEDRMAY